MPKPQAIVNKLLDAVDPDDPKPYVDWLGQKTEVGSLDKIRFGVYIHLSDEHVIRENATEDGVDVESQEFWDEIERCEAIIEANALQVLKEAGLHVSDEGHNENARVASVWIDTPEEDRKLALLKGVIAWAEGDWPSTTSGTMDYAFGANTTQRLYQATENAAKYLDVTIEFTGIDALVEWSKLNLNEAIEGNPDDPEVFLRSYVPRMKGRLMINFNAIAPHFPDAPASFYREDTDGTILFRYNRASEMREIMKQMQLYNRERGDRAGIPMVTYRYKVPNPSGHVLARQFLEKAGANAETIAWAEKTNAPILFYVSVPEFNAYIKMVYPQVKLKEGVDDPTPDYLNKVSPEACPHCNNDLTQRYTVVRNYVHRNGSTFGIEGHYDPADGVFTNDEKPSENLLANIIHCDLPLDSDTCMRCGQSTARLPQQEGVDDPEHYLKGAVYTFDELRTKLETYGLSFPSNGIRLWGRWAVIDGFTYWAVYNKDPDKYLPQAYFREQLEKFCTEMGFTVHHIQLAGEYPEGITFKLAVPKMQIDPEAYGAQERRLNDPDFGNEREAHEIIQREWLPESDDFDAEAEANRLLQTAPMHYNELRDWHPYIHHEYNVYHAPFIVPVFTRTGRLSKANSYLGWVRFKEHTYNEPPAWEAEVAKVRDVVPNKLPGFSPSKLKKRGFQIGEPFDPYRKRFYSLTMAESENPDPDDPAVNIERHTGDLDINAVMAKLGFVDGRTKGANWDGWIKQVGNKEWRVWPTVNTNIYGVTRMERPAKFVQVGRGRRYGQWSDKGHFTCHVTELEQQLREEGALNPPPVEEALDPDDPAVNIERHIEAMDAGKILEPMGFSERCPTWNCADPEYKWWEKFDNKTGFKWTVIRKSDDEPQTMEVSIYRSRLLPGHHLRDWVQIGGFKCHVGELKKKLEKAFRMRWGVVGDDRVWGQNVRALDAPVQETLEVPLPPEDEPVPNIEQHAQHVAQTEQDKLDTLIQLAVKDYEINIVQREIDNALGADRLVGDIAFKWAEHAGYANGSDEFDWLVSALNNRASEMFPGDLENPVQEAEEKMEWTEWMRLLVDEARILSQKAADRYKVSQTLESNEKLTELFCAIDEASQVADDALFNDLLHRAANLIRITNMRYGSALKDVMRKVEESERAWPLPGGFQIVRYSDENTLELRTPKGRPIGFIAWRSASDRMDIKYRTVELEHLEVDPRFQNRGLGKALVRRFVELVPQLYPDAKFVVAKTATSQGIIDLLREIFGPEDKSKDVDTLPVRSPDDWLHTQNRGYARFRLGEADEGNPEHYIKNLPIPVKATCIEDHMVEGERLKAEFNAAEWFEKATLEQLLVLAKNEFQSCYEADEVGEYFFDTQLKDWHENYRGDGFEVYIDEDSAKLWVEHNRPDWYAYLWPGEIQIKEIKESKETVDYPAVYIGGKIFIGPSHYHIMRQLESTGVDLSDAHHGWWTSRNRFLDTDLDVNDLMQLSKKFAQRTGEEPGLKGEELPKARQMTGVREVHEGVDDPTPQFMQDTFDVPTILKRMGYESNTSCKKPFEWYKVFRRAAKGDLMLVIKRRGLGGEHNEGDIVYDITLYNSVAPKEWAPIAHRYQRNNKQLERVLKVLEDRIKTNRLRGVVNDEDAGHEDLDEAVPLPPEDDPDLLLPDYAQSTSDNPDEPVEIKAHTHGSARRELEKLGFQYSTTSLKHKVFGEPEVPEFWHKRYPKSFGQVLFIRIFPEYTKSSVDLNFRTRYMPQTTFLPSSGGITVSLRGIPQFIAIVKELDAVMRAKHKTQEQEKQALEQIAQRHGQTVESVSLPPEDDPATYLKTAHIPVMTLVKSDTDPEDIEFDAATWFEQASVDELIYLAVNNFSESIAADTVAYFFANGSLKEYFAAHPHSFETYVNAEDAKRWVEHNRPDWYSQLWNVRTESRTQLETVDVPPEDDPTDVIKSHEQGLLAAELKRLDFGPKPEQGTAHVYGTEMPRYWWNRYQATNSKVHGLYVYFIGGQTPEVRANNWNFDAKAWFQQGKDAPTDSPAKSEAHFCAILRDLDDAMKRSAADSLSPAQENEAINAVLQHHRQWWDDTLDYLIRTKGGTIPGRIGPGEPA